MLNGDAAGYTNIDPCGFCTSNSKEQDYVVKEPWGAGGWSFSNFWNARKYIVEIPCSTTLIDPNLGNSLVSQNSDELDKELLTIEKLHPNPAMEYIYASIHSPIEQEVQLKIFDMRGLMVETITMLLQESVNKKQISIVNLPESVYTVLIPQINYENKAIRFVKNKG